MQRLAARARSAKTAWVVVLLAGCYASHQDFADVERDTRIDADAHPTDAAAEARVDAGVVEADDGGTAEADAIHDGDGEADLGVDADGDADAAGVCDGTWQDPTTGYLWENPPSDALRNWDDAIAYCNSLTLCGLAAGSWHLPDIDELRSLIRGCPTTMTGGSCGVTDSCLDLLCWSGACDGCGFLGGPGSGGCYWDGALGSACGESVHLFWSYWSSSSNRFPSSGDWFGWSVTFDRGGLKGVAKRGLLFVRCIYRGP